MSKHNKIEEIKNKLKSELNSETPNMVLIDKLKKQIIMLGLGLTSRDIKPF